MTRLVLCTVAVTATLFVTSIHIGESAIANVEGFEEILTGSDRNDTDFGSRSCEGDLGNGHGGCVGDRRGGSFDNDGGNRRAGRYSSL